MAAAWSYAAPGCSATEMEERERAHAAKARRGMQAGRTRPWQGGACKRGWTPTSCARAGCRSCPRGAATGDVPAPELTTARAAPASLLPLLFPSSMAVGAVAVLLVQEAQGRGGQMRARGRERMGSVGNEAGSEQLLRGSPCPPCTLVTFSPV
jgi:hypothetical protein